jgi:hypothetical protein
MQNLVPAEKSADQENAKANPEKSKAKPSTPTTKGTDKK